MYTNTKVFSMKDANVLWFLAVFLLGFLLRDQIKCVKIESKFENLYLLFVFLKLFRTGGTHMSHRT